MSKTISQPPEAPPLTAAERADEDARMQRARTGQYTRTLHALCEQAAVMVPCESCYAHPGGPCGEDPARFHLVRFAAARRRGLLTEAEMGRVLSGLDVFTNATVIRDGAS